MEVGSNEECFRAYGQAAFPYVQDIRINVNKLRWCHLQDYAAAFFLLGDSLKDCVNVCLKQLDDFHLAIMLARVYEGDEGPVLQDILNNHVIPLAFAKGHRRLTCWSFWMLKRRDLAVRAIIVSDSNLYEPFAA